MPLFCGAQAALSGSAKGVQKLRILICRNRDF